MLVVNISFLGMVSNIKEFLHVIEGQEMAFELLLNIKIYKSLTVHTKCRLRFRFAFFIPLISNFSRQVI